MLRTLLAPALLWAALPAAAAVPAPRLAVQNFEQLAQPLPLPYDTAANATTAVDRGRRLAKATHRLLLIDLGGNWCLDCRILAGTIEIPRLKVFVDRHYVVVPVDVGRFDTNLSIPAHYGITQRLEGVPSLLVVDPVKDRLLNAGYTSTLADARSMTPQGLADYLASWAR